MISLPQACGRLCMLFVALSGISLSFAEVTQGDGKTGSAAYHEIQLQGELIADPVYVPGYGVLVTCDDRSVTLLSTSGRIARRWQLPRFADGRAYAGGGLCYQPLKDGRIACISLAGGIVWIGKPYEFPAAPAWNVDEGGRLFAFSQSSLHVFRPDGKAISRKDFPSFATCSATSVDGGFLVSCSQGAPVLLDLEGELQTWVTPDHPVSVKSYQSGDGYSLNIVNNEIDFAYAGKGQLLRLYDNPSAGIVVWGDDRWKLGMKLISPVTPERGESGIEPATTAQELEDRKALGVFFSYGDQAMPLCLAYLKNRIQTLRNLDALSTLLLEILAGKSPFMVSAAAYKLYQNDFAAMFHDASGTSALAGVADLLSRRLRDPAETMRLALGMGLDPQGKILAWAALHIMKDSMPNKPDVLFLLRKFQEVFANSWPAGTRDRFVLDSYLRMKEKN